LFRAEKREHNKERLVMIVLEGILSVLLPAAVVEGAKHTKDGLASL
jgi:hypothetical protein